MKTISWFEWIFMSSISCSWCHFSIRRSEEEVIPKSRLSQRLPQSINGKLYTSHPSFLALTHMSHLSFIIILLLSLGGLTQCHSTYGRTYLKKITAGHKWWKESQRWGQMNSYVIICPFHSVPAVNSTLLIHLCVLAQIYGADLVIAGGVTRLGGTPSSLQSSPVRNPTGTGVELQQSPTEELCLNSVALYYPT